MTTHCQLLSLQAYTICAPDVNRAGSGAQNLWDAPDLSGVQLLPCEKINILDLQIYNRIGKAMKKL